MYKTGLRKFDLRHYDNCDFMVGPLAEKERDDLGEARVKPIPGTTQYCIKNENFLEEFEQTLAYVIFGSNV